MRATGRHAMVPGSALCGRANPRRLLRSHWSRKPTFAGTSGNEQDGRNDRQRTKHRVNVLFKRGWPLLPVRGALPACPMRRDVRSGAAKSRVNSVINTPKTC